MRFVKVVLVICILLILVVVPVVGCKPEASQSEVTYNVGVLNFPRSRNPFIGADSDTICYMPIFEPLLTFHGETGEIKPLLAKSWDWDAASVSYIFHIDPRAKFNDGSEVTADDVKYSWETAWNVAKKFAEVLALTKSITVVDSKTVKFTLNAAIANYLEYMGYCYIIPKAIFEKQDVMNWDNPNPVGSGPMLWTEYVADDHVTFTKNPDYWGGKLYIDRLIMRFYANVESQLLALRAGQIDTVNKLQMNSAVPTLLMDENIKVYFSSLNYTQQLLLNLRKEPLGILKYRQAMDAAVDRRTMVATVMQGYGILPLEVPIAPVCVFADKTLTWPYADKTEAQRITAANALLDQIPGLSTTPTPIPTNWVRTYNGKPQEWTLMVSTAPESVSTAEIIKAGCAKIGIKINVAVQSFTVAFAAVYRHAGKTPLGWDMFITGAPYAPTFTSFYNNFVLPEPKPLSEGGVWQARLMQSEAIGWTNKTIQDMLLAQNKEMDSAKRLTMQQQIQKLWVAELPTLQMYHTITPVPYRTDRFTGWIADMPTVVYNKNVEGYWSPYQLLLLKPVE